MAVLREGEIKLDSHRPPLWSASQARSLSCRDWDQKTDVGGVVIEARPGVVAYGAPRNPGTQNSDTTITVGDLATGVRGINYSVTLTR